MFRVLLLLPGEMRFCGGVWIFRRDRISARFVDGTPRFGDGIVRVDNVPVGDRLVRAECGIALVAGDGIRVPGDRIGVFTAPTPRDKLPPAENRFTDGGRLFRLRLDPLDGIPILPVDRLVPPTTGPLLRFGEGALKVGVPTAGPPRDAPMPPLMPRLNDRPPC